MLSSDNACGSGGHEVFQRPLWQPHYWVNPEYNRSEAREWIRLVFRHVGPRPDLSASCARFAEYVQRMGLRKYVRAYVFETGPSLGRAAECDWSDGARIVCNTIVRDRSLWHPIQPHIVLAADAGYHFGFTRHARAFRADLRQRLAETHTFGDELDESLTAAEQRRKRFVMMHKSHTEILQKRYRGAS